MELGPQGPAGQNGSDGNANVNSIGTFTFDMDSLPTSSPEYSLGCASNAITQDILDNGLVIGYKKLGTEWLMLNFDQSNAGYVVNYRGQLVLGKFEILIKSYQQDTYKADLNPPLIFRIVVIDGNRLASNPNVNWDSYEEVKIALDLKE